MGIWDRVFKIFSSGEGERKGGREEREERKGGKKGREEGRREEGGKKEEGGREEREGRGRGRTYRNCTVHELT